MTKVGYSLTFDGATYPLEIKRHPRARRVLLRFARGQSDRLVLTLPPRQALGPALKWAAGQGDFVKQTHRNQAEPTLFKDGAIIPIEGETITLNWREGASREPHLNGQVLTVGGPEHFVSGRIERWLKARALDRLTVETQEIASRHGLSLGRVIIGDPKGRWGSCAVNGNIRYSWRLILAPQHVRRAVVAHEVAHLRHHNHGPEFHALVDHLLGESARPAYVWLKNHGSGLHLIGRLA